MVRSPIQPKKEQWRWVLEMTWKREGGSWTNFEKRGIGVSNIGSLHKVKEVGAPLQNMNLFLFILTLISIVTALKEIKLNMRQAWIFNMFLPVANITVPILYSHLWSWTISGHQALQRNFKKITTQALSFLDAMF